MSTRASPFAAILPPTHNDISCPIRQLSIGPTSLAAPPHDVALFHFFFSALEREKHVKEAHGGRGLMFLPREAFVLYLCWICVRMSVVVWKPWDGL